MKKLMILFSLIVFLAACTPKTEQPPVTQPETAAAPQVEIGEAMPMEKTDKEANVDIKFVSSIEGGLTFKEACGTSGHIRRITVNGVCYSQMCCGGQWLFFYIDRNGRRDWCTCNLGESWTVNCDGNNWIVSCR